MKWREINGYNLKPCPFCGSDDVHLTETILTIGGEETGVYILKRKLMLYRYGIRIKET